MFRILQDSISLIFDEVYARKIKTELLITLLMLFFLLFTAGCSQVPYPTTYGFSQQKKMQAAQHWKLLAQDIAEQIKHEMFNINFDRDIPIYISPGDDTPFDHIFRNLLTSEFLDRKLQVSTKKYGSIEMKVEAKILTHNARKIHHPIEKWTTLGVGVNVLRAAYQSSLEHVLLMAMPAGIAIDTAFAGNAGDIPSNEVIISTSLIQDDKIIIQNVDIYYVNEPDWWHYDKEPYEKNTNSKTYKTVAY